MDIEQTISDLYRSYGPPKPMGEKAPALDRPHYFLHRNFLGEQDLTILFNTKRCAYQCKFCALPQKSSLDWIGQDHVVAQFTYVVNELKHSLDVLQRLTISNEGSVLDETTFPREALAAITTSTRRLPRLRKLVLETRLEFVTTKRLDEIQASSGKRLDILTGFETADVHIRDEVLGKREPLERFLAGLDVVAGAGTDLTTYVLYKPEPFMSDAEALSEAEASIDYVQEACWTRRIPLTIRLSPMYVARGTAWAVRAKSRDDYRPPRLTDVIALAQKKRSQGIPVRVGLTSEGLSDVDDTYRAREDFSSTVLKEGILINSDGSLQPHVRVGSYRG